MADCPQFQLMPQMVPIYRPQPPPLLQTPPPLQTMQTPPPMQTQQTPPPMQTLQTPPPMHTLQTPPPLQTLQTPPPLQTLQTPPPLQTLQAPPPLQTPPPNAGFPMPQGQPIFQMPPHFGYQPIAWSPVHHFPPPLPPPQQPVHDHAKEDGDCDSQQLEFNNNNNNNSSSNNKNISSANDSKSDLELQSRQDRQKFTRNASNKFDTRHEEFRKYLEEVGILSTFTNILSEMYQDPFRPNDPLGYIQDKLSFSRPETVELNNLRTWCDQYQTKTFRLEKELQHVIERLRKYEPYITDDSLFNESSTENECNSCVLDVSKLVLESKNENAKHGTRKNYNQQ